MTNASDHTTKSGKASTRAGTKAAAETPPLPKSWEDIKVGSLVIAQLSEEEGWWEAIVSNIANDMITVRWRDYPLTRPVARRRTELALFFPGKQ